MTTIATFTKTETGYIGEIHTLALKSKLTLSPADNAKGKAPDFRVIAEDGIEIGGAWKRKSKSGNAYLSVRLDEAILQLAQPHALAHLRQLGEALALGEHKPLTSALQEYALRP